LSIKCNTLFLPIEVGVLKDPVAVNIGNPHIVFFVDDVSKIPLLSLGPKLENHVFFPKRVNVSIVQIKRSGKIVLRVWERGTGITASCGSAACAALVASVLRKYLLTKQTLVSSSGGDLLVEWRNNNIFIAGNMGFL
ncbi:MAG: diaminopimelate epimerase, partial [Wolbachia pipientis]|nr:diaminopimelate epimerase [Wolbachia pipientis]